MQRIVVGIDGSEDSRAALRWALQEGRLRQASVEVVHTWHLPYVGASPYIVPVLDSDTYEKAARQVMDSVVDAEDTTGLPAPVTRSVVSGGAAGAIVEQARDADLIVVGSRGLGGFKGLLLGSVSQQVVHHAPCPVVVVPRSADNAAGG